MNKLTIFPLLLVTILLQGCGVGADNDVGVAQNKPLATFLSLHTQYCDAEYSSADELVSALRQAPGFSVSENYDGIFEKSVENLSYAISPEEGGCTTDLKLRTSSKSKPYFDFEDINAALLSQGYHLKGEKKIRTEIGLNNQELKVIEQHYVTNKNNISVLVFPLEHEDQYYMTLFVEKFEMQGVSLSADEPDLIEI